MSGNSRTVGLKYDGERLIPGTKRLQPLLMEDLAKFHFARQHAANRIVLDAGCGAGQGAAYLADNGALSVTAVDIAPDAVAFACDYWQMPNLQFAVADVTCLPFSAESFDMVTSVEVIEHLHDVPGYLDSIRRVLRWGGIYFMSTPNAQRSSNNPRLLWPSHIQEFFVGELQALLSEYFESVELWGQCVPIYESHPIRRLVRWLAPLFKPILPHRLRTTALPTIQRRIRSRLTPDDILISQDGLEEMPTILAICCKR
jgi:SAM-dependent methyltransferase